MLQQTRVKMTLPQPEPMEFITFCDMVLPLFIQISDNRWVNLEFCTEYGRQAAIHHPKNWDNFFTSSKTHELSAYIISDKIHARLLRYKNKKLAINI